MVIATRPKAKTPVHHKKRIGQHQRQTKHFAKTYWPYLPVLAAAMIANAYLAQQTSLTTQASVATTTRIEAWTNLGPWAAVIIALIASAAAAVFFTRHALIWKRVLVKSEQAVEHNRKTDVLLIVVALIGFIFTRSV